LLKSPVMIVISLATLIVISWKLTLFALLFLPLSGFLISRIAKSLKNAAKRGKGSLGDLISVIEETLTGNRIIKVFNAEKQFQHRFDQMNDYYFRLMHRLYRREYLSSPMSEFISLIVISILLFVGGRIVISGEMGGELLIGYLVVFSQIIQPARAFSDAIFKISKGAASLERINEILDAPLTVSDPENPKPLDEFNQNIEFKSIRFGYYGDPVIHDISFTIEKGQTVALVGPSGSGKSTLASLLARFYDPLAGSVSIDGISLRDCRVAAEEFIAPLQEQYEYNVGDGGNKLSGGQKQRLAIARALYKNPPILILDEATSALDTQSEKLVQEAIYKLMENRTSLVIAHRLSTIKKADKIIVIQAGTIAEQGTHEELMALGGVYRKLVDMQNFQ